MSTYAGYDFYEPVMTAVNQSIKIDISFNNHTFYFHLMCNCTEIENTNVKDLSYLGNILFGIALNMRLLMI